VGFRALLDETKPMKLSGLIFAGIMAFTMACAQNGTEKTASAKGGHHFEIVKTEAEWREELSAEAFYVLREEGTERAFTGQYDNFKGKGVFVCAACELPLFDSKTKFDSGTGWPSFYTVIGDTNVVDVVDRSLGWVRTEVVCGQCGGHLGHVFDDGPAPTGLRYCINSVSLDFQQE